MKLMTARGMKDFLPEEKIVLDKIISSLKAVFEKYGFSPLDTPAVERFDVLASKFAGGAEILKETFNFDDQGDRKLGLRYDLTVPMCRVVGMNPTIKMPFKRYQIDKVWRDGPVANARYREFYQCDVDVVGVKGMIADAEIVALVSEFFEGLGLGYEIAVNNRKILNAILDAAGIAKEKQESVILSIDKLDKIGEQGVIDELKKEKKLDQKQIDKVMEMISVSGSNESKVEKLEKLLKDKEGLDEMKELLTYCKGFGVQNFVFNVSLARGLAYYTGPVFEVLLKESKIESSVAGGGRYDKMISGLLGSKQEYPATGISFGVARIYDAVIEKGVEAKKTVTDLYIIPVGIKEEVLGIVKKARDLGIKCDFDLLGRGISKNLDYADKMGIPFVAIVGENELKKGEIKIKDMKSGKENLIKLNELGKLNLNP